MAKQKKENNKYKIILYNETTLHEVTSFNITSTNVLAYAGVLVFVIAVLVALLFVFTPLNQFLPSANDSKFHQELQESAIRFDSIRNVLEQRHEYFQSIRNLMDGNLDANVNQTDSTVERLKIDFAKSKHDSILQTLIEEEEQLAISMVNATSHEKYKNMSFFMPVKGTITQTFDLATGHLGIDIAAKDGEPVLSTLPGTVILATWSSETGNIIQVQHENNFLSIYKHNSALLKKVGDKVDAGEPIAIIGNSGELTTGTHLHFELWHNGVAVDPQSYIAY
jgi:murein DD-endopeptidase MepM/ murein hydrolase activator NlpD